MSDETEVAIARYRDDLVGEAELARGDLAEIEDHLRELAEELRATGMPRAEAIAEACRRLGDPREVAREHARVHTPFGARLSRMRAVSAVVLYAIPLALWTRHALRTDGFFATPMGVDLILTYVVLAALVLRRAWARPLVLGSLALATCAVTADLVLRPAAETALLTVCFGGALAFVMPWRRGELTQSGLALALFAPAYIGALQLVTTMWSASPHVLDANPLGAIAYVLAFATAAGIVLRARWAAIASAGLAWAILMDVLELLPQMPRTPRASFYEYTGELGVAFVCALAVAVFAWRSAPSFRGTLRHVLG